MKLNLFRDYFRNNHNDCDNHSHLVNLDNKNEFLFVKEFDSLKDELFEELRFEVLLNELAFDEDKTIEKHTNNLVSMLHFIGKKL